MKNNKSISEDELRQEIDGFSLEDTEENMTENKYKTNDLAAFPTHSADYDEVVDKK
jgi:hypothetical protein